MKPPARTLKRKRSFHQEPYTSIKTIKSRKVGHEQPPIPVKSAPSPPRDTTSETSGLTSADEIITITSATGVDSDRSKHASDNERTSVEANRTPDVVIAYRNAIEILVEIANRDRCRVHSSPYVGFGSPPAYYSNGPVSHYTTPYAIPASGTYTTPYSNPGPAHYITPYANPPVVAETLETSRAKKGKAQQLPAVGTQTPEKGHTIKRNKQPVGSAADECDNDAAGLKATASEEDAEPLSLTALDGFLALANGGVLPGQNEDSEELENQNTNNDSTLFAPPSPGDTIDEALSRSDDDVLALVDHISQDLITTPEPPQPAAPPNPYAASYSLMNSQQLGSEFKRLIDVVQPEVNAIMPREQIQVAHLFYTHLVSCIHTRNAANTRPIYQHQFVPVPGTHHWVQPGFPHPPPVPPAGYMIAPVQWPHQPQSHQQLRQAHLPAPTFVPRGNVVAPPLVRNVEAERKAAGFGFPPVPVSQQVPSSRPGLRSSAVNKGKRKSL